MFREHLCGMGLSQSGERRCAVESRASSWEGSVRDASLGRHGPPEIVVIARDGAVVALRASDGAVLWKRRLPARATTSPAAARGVLHVGAGDDRIYSLDAATGRVLHSVTVSGRPVGRPAVTPEALFFLIERTSKPKGLLIALDSAGKQIKWFREHKETFASEQPHVWRDVVVAGAVNAFSMADGTLRWQMKVGGCVRSIGSSTDFLFLGAQEGMVYAVRP
jgi:outer membrane protein assembly factor BamB